MSQSRRELWNERYAAKELVWSAGPNARFAEEVAALQPGTALDVACGEGRNAIWLAEQGWKVTGIDFSDVGIDKARAIADRRGVAPTFIAADILTNDFGDETYDLVALLYVHTAVEERVVWLPRVVRAVRPGGRLVYIGHDPRNILEGVGGPQDESVLPSVAELTTFLDGFDVLRGEVVERPVGTDPGHGAAEGIALDTVVHAQRR